MNLSISDCGLPIADLQLQSPALKRLDNSFPARFFGRVPKTVRMTQTVKPDVIPGLGPVPGYSGLAAAEGSEFPVWTNSFGAVSIIFPDGRRLGVKPDEFEVTEFFPTPEKAVAA